MDERAKLGSQHHINEDQAENKREGEAAEGPLGLSLLAGELPGDPGGQGKGRQGLLHIFHYHTSRAALQVSADGYLPLAVLALQDGGAGALLQVG